MKVSVTLFACYCCFISKCLENDVFSVEMDPCMQFHSSEGLKMHWLLKI